MAGVLGKHIRSNVLRPTLTFIFLIAISASGVVEAAGVTEEGYVRIGGIDQWIQIRGAHRENPVVLWLNGGPGFSTIPSTSAYSRWEEAFTVVMWDQRGEGKTFERSGRSVAAS